MSISELLPILDRNNIPYTIAEAGGGNTMMYVAIGAVVVVAVLAAVVVLSRKKKAAPAPQQPSQSQPEEGRQPVLRSMAGQHGGMVVPLHHQPVQVGRDRAVCRLVYQDGDPGRQLPPLSDLLRRAGEPVRGHRPELHLRHLPGGRAAAGPQHAGQAGPQELDLSGRGGQTPSIWSWSDPMKLSIYSYTNQGGREHNEDSLRWTSDGTEGVFVLADGLGGHDRGEVASQLAVEVICGGEDSPVPRPGGAAGALPAGQRPAFWSSRSSPDRRR